MAVLQQTVDLRAEIEKNGFAGPFQACTPEEMQSIRAGIEQDVLETPSKVYGFVIGRDRHLDSRVVYDLFTCPEVVSRLTAILGPDLMIWRSGFFYKPAGAPETAWHRARLFQDFTEYPMLELPDDEGLHQLTAWFAIDEATLENGCVQLIPGTHKQEIAVNKEEVVQQSKDKDGRWGADEEGFFGYNVKPDLSSLDLNTVASMECKPGEFFIFNQATLHGSPPNRSSQRRLGVNVRVITPQVRAYYHHLKAGGKVTHYGNTYDLNKWGCVLISGEDRYGLNKMVDPPAML